MAQDGPLAGLKILDLSRVLAAPLATMVLSDLGADVLKVERPGSGDETRTWGPPFVGGESAYFLSINRGKRDLAVDLSREAGRAVIDRLATTWADVVVENFRPHTLAHLGLDPEAIQRAAPHLIWARIRGYGAGDDRAGYDFVIQGASGLMALNGPPEGPPYRVGVAVSDMFAGLYLAVGILAALYRRETRGTGGAVEVALYEAQLASLINIAQSTLMTGQTPGRYGNAHPQLAPYEVMRAADGPFTVGVGNDGQFARLCRVLGRPDLAEDARFRDNQTRVRHRQALAEVLNQAFGQRPAGEWIDRLTAVGVPCGYIRTVDQALRAPETAQAGLVGEVPHVRLGSFPMVLSPVVVDGQRAPVRRGPPVLGQDTRAVLAELGYRPDEIHRMAAEGTIHLMSDADPDSERE